MKLSLVFLCLSLATLSNAATSSAKKKGGLSRSKQVKKDGDASGAVGKSSQAAKKKPIRGGKVLKKRPGVGTTKGVNRTSAGKKLSAVSGSDKESQESNVVLGFFPKVLVELIGGYLEGFYSVVFERSWSATDSSYRVAVDSERHYLITEQGIQASSHGHGVKMNIGNPDLSDYDDFHSSPDGRSLFFTGKTKEQVGRVSFEKTARWLVQETGTKGLKSVTLEGGKSFFADNSFKLSANGKTLLSTSWTTSTSVYQIKEHGKAASVSKKADFGGYARAVSGNGNRILLMCGWKWQLEIHDISRDGSNLVLEIDFAEATGLGSCALNNDGSKAAFIDNNGKLYIVDVDKEKGPVSIGQLAPIDSSDSFLYYSLIYDVKDRLYAFRDGNLWRIDPSESKLVSLDEAEIPQEYEIQRSAISSSADYIALLIRSKSKNKEEEHQYQMVVKRNDKVVLMRLCGYKS